MTKSYVSCGVTEQQRPLCGTALGSVDHSAKGHPGCMRIRVPLASSSLRALPSMMQSSQVRYAVRSAHTLPDDTTYSLSILSLACNPYQSSQVSMNQLSVDRLLKGEEVILAS